MYYILAVILIVFVVLNIYIWLNVSKRKKAITNLDRNEGLNICNANNQFFTSKVVQSLPPELSDINIDAYTFGEIRYIQSNHSDQESQLNEFSMLKFDSVVKFDYIMLSSNSLLIYDSQHEKYRLIQELYKLDVKVEFLNCLYVKILNQLSIVYHLI